MFTPDRLSTANQRADYRHQQAHNLLLTSASSMLSNNTPFHQQLALVFPTNIDHRTQDGLYGRSVDGLALMPPTPFHDLHVQRSYLISYLQHENIKAIELLRKIKLLEEDLLMGNFQGPKRKLKKQLGWLKQRHAETCRQEKSILAELGQVVHQIQILERTAQVNNELRRLSPELLKQPICCSFGKSMQPTSLNPAMPAFIPGSIVRSQIPTEWQQQHGDYNWQKSTHQASGEDEVTEDISPMDHIQGCQTEAESDHLVRPALVRRTVSMNDAELEESQRKQDYAIGLTLKRLSLPTIPGLSEIWGPTEEEQRGAMCKRSRDGGRIVELDDGDS